MSTEIGIESQTGGIGMSGSADKAVYGKDAFASSDKAFSFSWQNIGVGFFEKYNFLFLIII